MNEKTWNLDKVVYTFTQEGNTNGTTGEYEKLKIVEETAVDCLTKGEGFFVIKTKGWSIDEVDELTNLFKAIKRNVITKTKE